MPVYAKKVQSSNPRFQDRSITITSVGKGEIPGYPFEVEVNTIPVPNNVILCGGCNLNISEMEKPEGYLVYFSKQELEQDHPYDIYCPKCLRESFPMSKIVE